MTNAQPAFVTSYCGCGFNGLAEIEKHIFLTWRLLARASKPSHLILFILCLSSWEGDIPAPQRVEPQKIALCPFVLLISFILLRPKKKDHAEESHEGGKNINDFNIE